MSHAKAFIITTLLVAAVCFFLFVIVADLFISSGISSGVAAVVTVGPILAFVGIAVYWDFRSSRKHDAGFSKPREKYAVGNDWRTPEQ